ncbi:MAG: hypothetical protein A3G32_02745 [Deltaproteobacteria bacterium RIFCSPLOWO2_12_FULL_40_28]|nr:MAG: hypothetical protein A3C45_00125 [Deltaproteobacteria bacterium RIFCSPHIGHO2_02_FULL_40_28]OGQ20036.1 MAG: hypothetical protein A3E27_02790 [Deltaproteobacteria bacterium RIFCSPHIGHO2_12_FULL_40_32]OGQ40603.1 MAG: hypothetical protein A3I69_10215 [Deltaproteobacteria bacterium RIFCSPLOWO2_02_FULL_40_36]OGQ54272.1 MAG: hypothetical protein A3G32_02745 [Deltaproteobacteria bacterium RIFCSPLOWO2_12_FULL_40_28]
MSKVKVKSKEKGLLGIFSDPEKILEAAKKVRALKIEKVEAYTPFPIHGMEKALGLKRSLIPWATLVYGLAGIALTFLFQSWTSAVDWPLNVGGKPLISWPALIPVTFEGMVLFAGVLSFLTFFVINKLPDYSKPVLDERLTNDKFGLFIDETDAAFEAEKLEALLKECQAEEVKRIS